MGSGRLISAPRVAGSEQTAALRATGAGERPTPPTSSASSSSPSAPPAPTSVCAAESPSRCLFLPLPLARLSANTSPCCAPGDPSILRANLRVQWCSKSLEKAALGRDSRKPLVPSPSPGAARTGSQHLLAPAHCLGGRGEKVKWELQSRGGRSQSSDFIFIEAKHRRSVFFFLFCIFSLNNFFFFKETYFGGCVLWAFALPSS